KVGRFPRALGDAPQRGVTLAKLPPGVQVDAKSRFGLEIGDQLEESLVDVADFVDVIAARRAGEAHAIDEAVEADIFDVTSEGALLAGAKLLGAGEPVMHELQVCVAELSR